MTWFKNLTLYRLTEPFTLTPEQVGEAIARHAFRPCAGLDAFTYGWESPLGPAGEALVHAANGCILVCARREEKLMPPAVINDALEERIARIEGQDGRTVRRREKQRLRDEVIFDLLPRAFTRSARTFAYLAPASGWLVVDASSPRKAEDLVVLLGDSLTTLAVEPWLPSLSPQVEMTRWLEHGRAPDGFAILEDCELRDPADVGALVRCQKQDLGGDEIRAHLRARKQVHRLALGFGEHLSFLLGADLSIRRLRFENVEVLDEQDQPDEIARFDANFAYMTSALGVFLERLHAVFGDG
ncbi:MAG: recombination-associated protein RdgC [Ectothiorhodospiraceae bacterium]|nr:recombination-associated protein RdgC [Chromatiales bacterium]MCP5153880.1 recombination-associated protein RdgC [Ectothiorhodospiraceae bacterium]